MYYAVKFCDAVRNRLFEIAESFYSIPDDWKTYCDHITICHSSNENWDKWNSLLCKHIGIKAIFYVKGYGKSDNALALAVRFNTANPVSHITIACAPGAKPVQSNDIKDWVYPEEYDFSEYFIGTLELCN